MHRKPKSKWLHDREGIAVEARIEEFSSDDFEVERLLGSYGYINVSSYIPPQPGSIFGGNLAENAPSGFDRGDVTRISGQEVEEGSVQTRTVGNRFGCQFACRLYSGQIRSGDCTCVLLKVYNAPSSLSSGCDALTSWFVLELLWVFNNQFSIRTMHNMIKEVERRGVAGIPSNDNLRHRAAMAGACMAMECKAFGIADDMYYEVDDRWVEAVRFLDLHDGARWQLLQHIGTFSSRTGKAPLPGYTFGFRRESAGVY
ncbi:unnamed protein product [Sphagnum troendelagicum]